MIPFRRKLERQWQIWIILIALSLSACTTERDSDLLLDLTACTLGGNTFEKLLKRDAQGNFGPELSSMMAAASDHGILFGMCGIDADHGQSMLVRFADQYQASEAKLSVNPKLSYGMSSAAVEDLFGLPDVPSEGKRYIPKLLSGNRPGVSGRWAGVCPDFTLQLTFDEEIGLTRLIVFPVDMRQLDL